MVDSRTEVKKVYKWARAKEFIKDYHDHVKGHRNQSEKISTGQKWGNLSNTKNKKSAMYQSTTNI